MTAAVIGTTGLIGSHLVAHLQDDPVFETVRLLVRRPVASPGEKFETRLVDFNDPESFRLALEGVEIIFCAVGTTQRKVRGNKDAYRAVDYDIPVHAAKYGLTGGCRHFVVISSVGADPAAKNFYLQLKGKMEESMKQLNISSIDIFRPSLLLGDRNEKRPMEKLAQLFFPVFSFAMKGNAEKYKPVKAADVSKAMVSVVKHPKKGVRIHEFSSITQLASL